MQANNEVILSRAQETFFAAMLYGWASGAGGSSAPGMPAHKEFEHQNGFYRLLDRYAVSKAGKSAGTTTIWFNEEPVWFMSYGGFYHKQHIPFLKKALMHNYESKVFLGGRGPAHFEDPEFKGLAYFNMGARVGKSDFNDFRVSEIIYSEKREVGQHYCWGMQLLEP